jgi:hypothetical protein
MNSPERNRWLNGVIQEVLIAVVAHPPLRAALVFKGARILNLHLGTERQSLDIDSNLCPEFIREHAGLEEQQIWLKKEMASALRKHFESQSPVRFTIQGIEVRRNPPKIPHPRNWDAMVVVVKVSDEKFRGVLGLPNVEIEIAAPELLGPKAVTELSIQGHTLRAYALHRIAGEKLRAFLTSLPAYREKMKGGTRAHRVKDLHDLARILASRPIQDDGFWRDSAAEFRLACESRLVDCVGLDTFLQGWEASRTAYTSDATLNTIPFSEAEQALRKIIHRFVEFGVFPLEFPLAVD